MPFEAEQHAVPLERLCCFLGICKSVRAIVKKYNGRCSIEAKDKKFTVRIMLLTS